MPLCQSTVNLRDTTRGKKSDEGATLKLNENEIEELRWTEKECTEIERECEIERSRLEMGRATFERDCDIERSCLQAERSTLKQDREILSYERNDARVVTRGNNNF